MGELRKDYFLDRWVIINPKRNERPHQFVHKKNPGKVSIDYFASGNEKYTPEEIGRIGTKKGWQIRWFKNKFPAVQAYNNFEIRTDNHYFTFSDSFGWHEVIVETNKKNEQIWDFKKEHLIKLLKVYQSRLKNIRNLEGIKYVSLFKNHGPDAGTSIEHSHSQIIAYNLVPEIIKEKINKSNDGEKCLYCEILNVEKKSFRRCFENELFVAFTPYASRFNYEIWLMPKEHITDFASLNDSQMVLFSEIFYDILKKLKELNCSFNFNFQNFNNLHFHVEFTPRISKWAGFEICTDTIINSTAPEDAAEFYRKKDEN